jgi:HK97 family phage major capsid protein
MKKSDQLKLERAGKVKAQGDLLAKAKAENRDLNETETASFDALDGEIAALDTNIERAVKIEAAELRAANLEGRAPITPAEEVKPKAKRSFSIHRAILAQMGEVELTEEETTEAEQNRKLAVASGITPRGFVFRFPSRKTERAVQTVTGDSGGYGGNTVATEVLDPIDFLRPEPLLSRVGATYLRNCVGDLSFPKNNGGIVATWEGETDETESTANAYDKLGLKPKRLSVTVPISVQNLYQSNFDIESYTVNQINLAIENKLDETGVNGTGSGQPFGILNTTGINTVATGTNGSALTWDMVVDAETAVFVENGNASRMNYLINPKTRGKLKKTKHEAGDFNYLMTPQNEINGYPVQTSNHVPSTLTKGTGTALSALVFGDFSQIFIAQWGMVDFTVDPYSRKKEGLVEITVNLYMDMAIKQPKAFTVIKGIITT